MYQTKLRALAPLLSPRKEVWGPHLIVVPSSVLMNWVKELKKWTPGAKKNVSRSWTPVGHGVAGRCEEMTSPSTARWGDLGETSGAGCRGQRDLGEASMVTAGLYHTHTPHGIDGYSFNTHEVL